MANPAIEIVHGGLIAAELPPDLVLQLQVTDRESIAELMLRAEGRDRDEYALSALQIGLLSLKHARGQVDTEAVRREAERLVTELNGVMEDYRKQLNNQLATTLREYFDPNSGRLSERIERLVKKDGELEQVIRRQIGVDGSELARTLATYVGENSLLMRALDPEDSQGLLSALSAATEQVLENERNLILSQFSLDHPDSALSRLVREITDRTGQLRNELAGEVHTVVSEFSLDKPDSALSRLVSKVDQAQRRIAEEFSLDNEKSALSRMSQLLTETQGVLSDSLTLDKPQSALARLRREITEILERHEQQAQTFQNDVTRALEAMKTKRDESLRSTAHGRDFEAMVYEFVQREAQRQNDIPIATGDTTGAIKYCKIGDAVIELSSDSAALGQRIVIEAKEDASYDLAKARAEIETARKNREASVGVFVFSKKTAPAAQEPLLRYGDDVFLTWDTEDLNSDLIFRAGLSLAKALSIRNERVRRTESADMQAMDAAILEIETEANRLAQMKTWTETIHSSSDKLLGEIGKIQKALDKQLDVLRETAAGLRGSLSWGDS